MTRFSIRTTFHDGTQHFDWREDDRKARNQFSNVCRNARSAVKLVELRQHDAAGVQVLESKEGSWRTQT